jgi:hypothetical protein
MSKYLQDHKNTAILEWQLVKQPPSSVVGESFINWIHPDFINKLKYY